MDHLSIVAQVLIVAAAGFAGPLAVFVVALSIALLMRAIGGAEEPPPVALAVAGLIGRRLRAILSRGVRSQGEEVRADLSRRNLADPGRPAPSSL